MLPGLKRGLDLDFIVDTSLSMTVWQQTVTSFQTLLTGLGAFADIRVTSWDTDDPNASLVPLPESANRRLAVVLSDCVGRAWSTGNVLRSLEPLAETTPLTIVQMLPQRLWAGCGVDFVPVQVGAHRGGDGAVRLWTGARPGYPNMGGEGVPIPVLELDDRWLAPWASLIAGETTSPIAGMAVHSHSARDVVQSHEVTAPQRPGRTVPVGSVTDSAAPGLIPRHRAAQFAGPATAPVDGVAGISSCGPRGGLPQRPAAPRPSA